jgi:hypothetical protein
MKEGDFIIYIIKTEKVLHLGETPGGVGTKRTQVRNVKQRNHNKQPKHTKLGERWVGEKNRQRLLTSLVDAKIIKCVKSEDVCR